MLDTVGPTVSVYIFLYESIYSQTFSCQLNATGSLETSANSPVHNDGDDDNRIDDNNGDDDNNGNNDNNDDDYRDNDGDENGVGDGKDDNDDGFN